MLALVTNFGKFIEQAIYARGETFEEFGKQVGATRTAVANWVTHDVQPRRKVCYKIAEVLEKPVEDILEMAGHARDVDPREAEYGRKVGDAYVAPGTPLTRQQLAEQLAELERVFSEKIALIRESIQQEPGQA